MHWTAETLERVLTTEVLPLVTKPNRYVGNELGLAPKDWDETHVRFVLCYPDAYEVGMSHTGTQILYHIVNRDPRWLLDRVYAPWPDMEAQLRARGIPLWGLQHKRPVRDYDILGFTLQSELTYTNLLNVIDLAGIPIHQADRRDGDPLVCIGGPCASNPEPLAPFIDFALIGDAEDAIGEILEVVAGWKKVCEGSEVDEVDEVEANDIGNEGNLASSPCQPRQPGKPCQPSRSDLLERLALEVPGIYVPSLYSVPPGRHTPRPRADAPAGTPFPVVARKVPALRPEDHPRRMVVSLTETTHDRLPIEVMRGCMRGCRFCQAGYLYRPARERDVDETLEIAEEGIKHSGWQEVSLLSLSTADYSQALELTERMGKTMVERGVGVSLPSLRADAFSVGLAENVSRVRKSGFTFAPEAGSQRLRNVINKGITEQDILSAVERAMSAGWTSVKLYFMIGHPTERQDDFEELAKLVGKIKQILKRFPGRRHITLGFSPFVPKSHTPFQWERQDSFETTREKLAWIRARLRGQSVEIRHHETADTAIEGVISRGGREIAPVIEAAWKKGARFDGWSELCRFEHWESALVDNSLTLSGTFREREEDDELPWEIVSYKIDRKYFLKERHKAYEAAETDECKHIRCTACGVCDFEAMHNLLAAPAVTASPETEAGLRQGGPATTVRFRYAKDGSVRFTSHLDVQREIERAIRRAGLPILYSEGFAPRPRISAGPPLALGWTSDSEWIDLDLSESWNAERLGVLLEALNSAVAPGFRFLAAAAMPVRTTSLVAGIACSDYTASFPEPPFDLSLGALEDAARAFLAREEAMIVRDRKGRPCPIDIRPMVREFTVTGPGQIVLGLATGADGSVKPTEVLQLALGLDPGLVPLIPIHKFGATLATGEDPSAGAVVRTEAGTFETRDTHCGEPARNACGDPRG